MKKMFLASFFADVAELFVKFTDGKCVGKIVTFIPTASLNEEINFYVANARKAFKKQGMIIDELEISTATKEEIRSKLQENDYIYISGGNTFFLLQELRKSGADKIITEQINLGKMYIGESAGSVIISDNIEYVKEMDDFTVAQNLDSFLSLGLADFYPLPHYKSFPFEEAVDNIIANYAKKIKLCPISNTQAIIVNGQTFEVLSK